MKKFLVVFLLILSSCKSEKKQDINKIKSLDKQTITEKDINSDETIKKKYLNVENLKKSFIQNSKIDTSLVFGVWGFNKTDPHAIFYLDKNTYYIPDHEEEFDYKYVLDEDYLIVFKSTGKDFGKILEVSKDSLSIDWFSSIGKRKYVRFDE